MQWSQAIGFDVQLKKYALLGGNMLLNDEFSLVIHFLMCLYFCWGEKRLLAAKVAV